METDQATEGAILLSSIITRNSTYPDHVSDGIPQISAVCLSLSFLCLALRIYTRVRILKVFYREDYVIVAAWLFNVASTVTYLEQEIIIERTHLWNVPLRTFAPYGKWAAASVLLFIPAIALPKFAILLSYLRVFPSKYVRIRVYVVFVVTIGCVIASYLALWLQCHPAAKFWDRTLPGYCLIIPELLANAALNVAIDIMVLLVPVRTLIEWNVNWRMKSLIGGVIAIGSLTCIVSAVRVYFVARILHNFDTTHVITIPGSLGVVESNLSVICGCLMVIRPFLRRHFPFLLGINPEHSEHTSTHTFVIDHRVTELNTAVEPRPIMSAGFGGVNSSAGWIWNQGSRNDNHGTDSAATRYLGTGSEVIWPLRYNMSLKREEEEKNLDEVDCHKTKFAQAIQVLDLHFAKNGDAYIQARTASFVSGLAPCVVKDTDLATILE